MRIESCSEVIAWPMQKLFRVATSPAFVYSDWFSQYDFDTVSAEDIEFDRELGVIFSAPVLVPHNNYVINETPDTAPIWFNASLPTQNWTRNSLGGRLKYMAGILKNPKLRASWTSEPARSIYYGYAVSNPGSSTRYSYVPTDNTFDISCSPPSNCQGGYLQVAYELDGRTITWSQDGFGNWIETITNPLPSMAKPYFDVEYWIKGGEGDIDRRYTIRYRINGVPELYKNTDPLGSGPGDKVRDLKLNNSGTPITGGSQQGYYGQFGWYNQGSPNGNILELRILNSVVRLFMDPSTNFVLDDLSDLESESERFYLHKITLRGSGVKSFQAGFAPMKFRANATFISKEVPLGFVPNKDAEYKPLYARKAISKTGFDSDTNLIFTSISETGVDSFSQYELSIESPVEGTYDGIDYSSNTAILRGVTVIFPEEAQQGTGVPLFLAPEEITVSHYFDFDSLTINSNASLVFNNFSPVSKNTFGAPNLWWGEIANYSGTFAVQIDAITRYFDENNNVVFVNGPHRLFTGIASLKSSTSIEPNGQSKHVIQCVGREAALKSPKFYLPWVDGWNIYAAIAYYANNSGIYRGDVSDSDLGFINKVPDDPFGDSPTGDSFFLPVGSGGYPLMRANTGANNWDNIGRIAKQFGYYYFFDNFGRLQFDKFELRNSPVAYRIFNVVDNILDGAVPSPGSAVMNGSIDRDLTQVRNKVTIMGIDAYGGKWDPLISHRTDENSIYNFSQSTALDLIGGNFLGFENAFVWVDSQFATLDYASDAADAAFEILKVPSITGSMTSWPQFDIFPGVRVGIHDVKSGAFDRFTGKYLEFMVTGITHVIRKGFARSNMNLRYIPRISPT
jgi:hypothetical protein